MRVSSLVSVVASLLGFAVAFAGCVGTGDLTARVSGQTVDEYEQPLGPGLVLVERGRVHAGSYIVGAEIDESGRWSVDLPSGGTFGLHLFIDDYQYLPAEITIEDHQQVVLTSLMISWGVWMDLTGQHSWPTQPDDATLVRMPVDEKEEDNPILHSVTMEWASPELLRIRADVSDPDGDLSRMILAYDEATGTSYKLNAPSPPNGSNFPDGVYELMVGLDEAHVPGESVWQFVVSDNLCNDTDLLFMVMPPL